MKQPPLIKRMSKYKVKKTLIDCSFICKKQIIDILKKRGYTDNTNFYIKGFVKVYILDFSILVCLDKDGLSKSIGGGSRCFFEESIFNELISYYENRNK